MPERTQPAQESRDSHEGPQVQLYELELEKRRAALRKLDASKPEISFGSQIRSYVMQPYQLIKDHRTKVERGDVQKVLDGDIDTFHPRLPFVPPRSRLAQRSVQHRRPGERSESEGSLLLCELFPPPTRPAPVKGGIT